MGSFVRMFAIGACGHVCGTWTNSIEEKYPFYCGICDEDMTVRNMGSYPWEILARVFTEGQEPVAGTFTVTEEMLESAQRFSAGTGNGHAVFCPVTPGVPVPWVFTLFHSEKHAEAARESLGADAIALDLRAEKDAEGHEHFHAPS